MRKASFRIAVLVIVLGLAAFAILTAPSTWRLLKPSRDLPDASAPDLKNGRTQFLAGDCATCHATPGKENENLLGGGRSLDTAFGVFHMPNISPHAQDGIGGWSIEQFVMAMREGVLPHGGNAYPAFPYTSYQRMTANDLRDVFAYIKTLPPVAGKAPGHDLKFPYSIRRGVGVWRLAFLDGKPLPDAPGHGAEWLRGRYLVEGAGHCAECHSPRNALGVIPADKRYAGGPNPEGTGHVPNITPDDTGIGYWSVNDIATYLKEGVSPIGVKAGGDMKAIVANTSLLSREDRLAMAVYLKSLPAVDAPNAGQPRPNRTEEVVMLPQGAVGARSRLDALVATGDAVAKGKDLYVVAPTPFYLAQPGAAAQEDGKLLGSTRVAVLARQGDLMQVRVDGWQQDGSESALYAMQGQRILQAVLTPAAIARIAARGERVRDAGTGQSWQPAALTVWIRGDSLNPDLDQLWRHSRQLFSQACATCHALPHTQDFLANQWIGTLAAMKRYTSLDDKEYRLLLAWLQYHAKDTGGDSHGQEGRL